MLWVILMISNGFVFRKYGSSAEKIMSVFTSKSFASAAASGTDWRDTSKAVLEQLESIRTEEDQFNFGFLYISDMLADFAPSILNLFRSVTHIEHWIGSVGMGVIGTGQAFVNQPAISALIGHFPEGEFCVFPETREEDSDPFSPDEPLSQDPVKKWLGQHMPMLVCVHADPMADDDPMAVLADLESLSSGFIVGGLTSSRSHHYQFANTVCENSVSGVFFSDKVPVATSLSQGCQPISPFHTITKASGTTIYELDGASALRVLLRDLKGTGARGDPDALPLPDLREIESSEDVPLEMLPLFSGQIHIALPISQSDQKDYLVRNIMGIDPAEESLTLSQSVSAGENLLFVRRTEETVLEDLSKTLLALRQRIEAERGLFAPKAGLYISCIARGFAETSEAAQKEIDALRGAIGDVPLTGFYAGGEINDARLYGYTGLLILFL